MSVRATRTTIAGRISRNMEILLRSSFSDQASSHQVQASDDEVDRFDADERNGYAADAVDPEITQQQRAGADRTITYTLQRQGDQSDDDQRIKDNRRQNGAFRRCQLHNVQRL